MIATHPLGLPHPATSRCREPFICLLALPAGRPERPLVMIRRRAANNDRQTTAKARNRLQYSQVAALADGCGIWQKKRSTIQRRGQIYLAKSNIYPE